MPINSTAPEGFNQNGLSHLADDEVRRLPDSFAVLFDLLEWLAAVENQLNAPVRKNGCLCDVQVARSLSSVQKHSTKRRN